MKTRPPRVSFGHPQFASAVIPAFPRFFEILPRLSASFRGLARKRRRNLSKQQKVVLNLSLMAGIAMEELVLLVGNGFGMGAMKIARNILELSINAEFIRTNSNAVEDYIDWYWVEQQKWLNYARAHDSELLGRFEKQSIRITESEFARVRTRFLRFDGKTLRGSWCDVDLGTRAIQAHMEVAYRLINPYGSQFIHGTAGSLFSHFDTKADTVQIAPCPSLKFCAQALCGGHNCLAMVIHTLESIFQEEAIPNSDAIAADFQYAWPAGVPPMIDI